MPKKQRTASKNARRQQQRVGGKLVENFVRRGWEPDREPWLREAAKPMEGEAQRKVLCYFCGSEEAVLSLTDIASDHGRLEIYCDNPECDAREQAIIVLRDGGQAYWRADVYALEALDEGRLALPEPAPVELVQWAHESVVRTPEGLDDQVAERRKTITDW